MHTKAISGIIILSLFLISNFSSDSALIGSASAQVNTQQPPTGSNNTAGAGANNTEALVANITALVANITALVANTTSSDGNTTAPIANAGSDQTVNESQAVQLDGSASTDPDGDTLTYAWNQTAGTHVSLSSADSATPSFIAPDVDANRDTLIFELTVDDGNGHNATDTVNVKVSAGGDSVDQNNLINMIFSNYIPQLFIFLVFLVIIIPLVLDIILAYRGRREAGSNNKDARSNNKDARSNNKESFRVRGMPGLNRSLMTFGIIVLLGTVIFYLLALITLNINNPTNPVFASLVDLLRNLGIILGTALATIIAFYFGIRGSESAVEKAASAITEGMNRTKVAEDKVSPKVVSTEPANGAPEVPLDSLITATFSVPMSIGTINKSTFTVIKEGETDPIEGVISFSSDAKTVRFDADPDLKPNSKYTAEISIGAKDIAGNALASAEQWSFTTALAPGPSESGGKEKIDDTLAGRGGSNKSNYRNNFNYTSSNDNK